MPAVRSRTLTRAVTGTVAAIAFTLLSAPGAGASDHLADPPGNNGTVKLDGLDLADGPGHTEAPNDPGDTDPDTDPHLTCRFQVEFFGFDEAQRADLTVTAHAPTGDGAVVLERSGELISDDAAGGGPNDPDAVLDVAVDDLATDGFTFVHDQHGWHVKLTVEVFEADGTTPVPGGVKHKVFWLEDCAPTTPAPPQQLCPDGTPMTDCDVVVVVLPEVTPTPPVPPAPAAPAVPAPSPGPAQPLAQPVAQPTPPTPAPSRWVELIGAEVVAAVAPAPVTAPVTAPDTEVLGVQVVRQLPRTGSSTTVLAAAGALLVLTGAALSSAGRRRAAVAAAIVR